MMPSATQLLIVLVIAVLLFGTKRLRQLGGDLGGMIRGVREGVKDAEPVVDELQSLKSDVQSLTTRAKEAGYVRSEITNYDR